MLERILWIIATLFVVVAGFFFLAAAAVAGIVIAAVILVRLWWLKRKLGTVKGRPIITTEYTVIERESLPANRLPDETTDQGQPGRPPREEGPTGR